MPPAIQLIEQDATSMLVRMPIHLGNYIISTSTRGDFDIDFHELSETEITPALRLAADQTRNIPQAELINI